MKEEEEEKMDLAQEIELKANLLVEGLRIEEPALEGVGTRYNETETWLFLYQFEGLKPSLRLPNDMKLPQGTLVQVRLNSKSPYLVTKEDGTLVLRKKGKFVTEIEWTARPKFYDQLTSDGVPMSEVVQMRGEDLIATCYSNYCLNWRGGNECRFCNFEYTHNTKEYSVLNQQEIERVGEAAAAALEELGDFHIGWSGGALPGTQDTELSLALIESVRRHTGLEWLKGFPAHPAAPKDEKQLECIDRLHQAGAMTCVMNLEVWHSDLFAAICPGKAKNVGRNNWLRALDHAVSVFGRGRVISSFVTGIEYKESLLEGCQYLTERGIQPLLILWTPMVGSKLQGHRSPTPEWHLEVTEKMVDLIEKYIPDLITKEGIQKAISCTCYRCWSTGLQWDEIRRRVGGAVRVLKRDKVEKEGVRVI